MVLPEILALLIFLFPLAFSPGPGNMFFAASGARFGFKNTLTANFGYHLATIIITYAIGMGFGVLYSIIQEHYFFLKIFGSAYIIHLSYKFYKAGIYNEITKNLKCTFFDGVALLIFNPKAYIIISLMFVMFLNNSENVSRLLLITLIFTFNNFVSFTLWTLFGDLIGSKFRNEKYSKILNNTFSLMLLLVAIWMFVVEVNF